VGILDLGNRSAAMFEVSGAVQSVALGRPVGSSGWLLTKIQQQEITLKRGAETKVVLVGQKF
jgi:Tfp pilus assembly protein PilP